MSVLDVANAEVAFALSEEQGDFEKIDRVRDLALGWHTDFDKKWAKGSYHNEIHIKAVEQAAEKLLNEIDTNDVFNLKGDLLKWNRDKDNSKKINLVEMEAAIKIAFYSHDLGNIMEGTDIAADGSLSPRYFDIYKAKGAEERSKKISRDILVSLGVSKESLNKILPFVQHLIGETTYDFKDKSAPFSSFMRVVDQIGNYFFNKTDFQNGLLKEIVGEDNNAVFVPDTFFNFINYRMPYLVAGKGKRDRVLQVWDKTLPKMLYDYSRDRTLARKYLEEKITFNLLNFNSD